MADIKMPEINMVMIAGNLTRDPIFRETSSNTPVVNFNLAANRKYKDSNDKWQEDVCYVGVVAWSKLAESCKNRIRKGSAVLVEGELQSRISKTSDGKTRQIIEIKAKRIQFLNKHLSGNNGSDNGNNGAAKESETEIEDSIKTPTFDEGDSFDKFLSEEETDLLNNKDNNDEV